MTLLRVLAFSLAVLLSYTVFANILPQVQSNPPEEEEPAVAAGEMTLEDMAAWGDRLFSGKGTCTLCHNNLGRAPDLLAMDLSAALKERLADARYDGEAAEETGAKAVEVYLRESLVDPSAYVVAGFGKKGTNDTVSPMPAVDGAPISLSETEIDAVIAYLQDAAGGEITVPLPSAEDADDAEEDGEDEEEIAETADAAVEKFGCGACHDLAGSGADAGPKLGGIGARLGADGVRTAIIDPNAELAKGFEPDLMPDDYAEQMRVSELRLLVDYLMTLPAEGANQ